MIKIGDLVKFHSFKNDGHYGYGIYVGEEDDEKKWGIIVGKSKIRLLYYSDPNTEDGSRKAAIWYRALSDIKKCKKEEKTKVAILILKDGKIPGGKK